MIDEQSSASEHDYASYRSAIGAGSLPHGEACYLVRIPVHIALLKKGYYCQTQGLFEVTTGHRFWSTCLR